MENKLQKGRSCGVQHPTTTDSNSKSLKLEFLAIHMERRRSGQAEKG